MQIGNTTTLYDPRFDAVEGHKKYSDKFYDIISVSALLMRAYVKGEATIIMLMAAVEDKKPWKIRR